MTTTKLYSADGSFALTDVQRRAMIMRSADPAKLARPAHDYILDPRGGPGHASGAVPPTGTALGAGGLINLARNSHRVLAAAVQGAASAKAGKNGTVINLADDGAGHVGIATPGALYNQGGIIQKAGIADNLVGHPPSEGWRDFLYLAWVRSAAAQGSLGGYSTAAARFWGINIDIAAAKPRFIDSLGGAIIANPAADTWVQVAVHCAFNTGTGVITSRRFFNRAEVGGAVVSPLTTASMGALAFAAGWQGVCGNGFDQSLTGLLGRAERLFTGIADYTLDPLEEVVRNWDTLRASFGL